MERVRIGPDGPGGGALDAHVARLAERWGRPVVGLTGSPGSGKSTLAAALAAAYAGVVVPMDGFHVADVELARRGLLEVKGAPETFDAHGYAALLARVRAREHTVLAPMFERDLEQPVAGAIPLPPDAGLVVAEGNYLLLPDDPWPGVRAQLDAVWYIVVDEDLRAERLLARHVASGKDPDAAAAWITRVDEPNAERVEAAAGAADLVLDMTGWVVPDA